MDQNLLLVAFLGFAAGYIFKTLILTYIAYSHTALFVQRMGYQALGLLGEVVYKISYVEQLCAMELEKSGNVEEAKKLRLEFESQFDEWKEESITALKEYYPREYLWQLEFDDWKGMINELTYIYKEKKM